MKDTEIYNRWVTVYREMITWDAIVKYQIGKPISEMTRAENALKLAYLKGMEFALGEILGYPSTRGIGMNEETYKREIAQIEDEIK